MNAYILVGGRSSRMGRDKSAAVLDGRTFLSRVLETAAPVCERVFAVQRHGGLAAEGVETIFEAAREERGPVFGLLTALEHARGPALVIAVDYPLVTSSVLEYLAGRYRETRPAALLPVWNCFTQTLCGVWGDPARDVLVSRVNARQYDLHGLASACGAVLVDEVELRGRFDGEPLMNVNTPEELARAEALLRA